MGFFRDLIRRFRRPATAPAPASAPEAVPRPDGPKLFGGPEDDTPMVAVPQGRAMVMMDRMAYEYQAGLARGDDPAQGALDAAFAPADRVRVLAGGMYRDAAIGTDVLAEENDPEAVAALVRSLRIEEDPSTFGHCLCLGHPTIEFYAGTELLGAVAVHHGRSIRWPRWKHDARLSDPAPLAAWLALRGLAEEDLTRGGNSDNFLELLALTPARRHAGRADSYRIRGDHVRALAECARAVRDDPKLAVARAIQSSILHAMGKLPESFAAGEAALALGFEPPEFRVELANCYQEADRPERALALCDEAIAANPGLPPAHDVRGLALLKLDRKDEALSAFESAVLLAPEWPPACWHAAMTRALTDDHAGAVAGFTRFLALIDGAPDSPSTKSLAHALRGRSRLALGEVLEGREDASEAIRVDPDHPEGYRVRGMALEMMGRHREALTDYADLVRLRPDDPDALRRLASAQGGSGDIDGLLGSLERILELQPEDAEARFAQAQAYLNTDRTDEALESLNEALGLRPDSAMGYALRSICWKRLGRTDLLAEDLETALRWEPENPALLNNSAWLMATSPDPDLRDGARALSRATKAREITEGKVSFVLGTLSAALAECGRMDEARATLKSAMALEAPPEIRTVQAAMREAFEAGEPFRDED